MYRAALVRLSRRLLGRALPASVVLAGALLGCGTSLPLATSGDAARAGVQLAELQEGRSLVAAKCGNCHAPPVPAAHHMGEWPHMLDEMSARSHLDLAQRHLIEQYLMTLAAR
jgi:cytochrome c5